LPDNATPELEVLPEELPDELLVELPEELELPDELELDPPESLDPPPPQPWPSKSTSTARAISFPLAFMAILRVQADIVTTED
jgi:hypothetical protein